VVTDAAARFLFLLRERVDASALAVAASSAAQDLGSGKAALA
jgi:hypothetical protein